jgi:diaminopimelate decarboxylase/aspartate kinase
LHISTSDYTFKSFFYHNPKYNKMNSNSPVIVLKFGGTSVSNLSRWQQIVDVIQRKYKQGYKVALVHSAKSGVTNILEKFTQTQDIDLATQALLSLQQLANELEVNNNLDEYKQRFLEFTRAEKLSTFDIAEILSFGEIITHKIAFAFISKHLKIKSIDPKTLFITNQQDNRSETSKILSAKCEIKDFNDFDSSDFFMMPGFVAADNQGRTVVLGRGGSDTSASYLAVAMKAKRIEIWTDVHGIFSANPHVIPSARLIEKIGYEEAREIAASGGKVLHPRCILPAEENNIPIHIINSQDIHVKGTVLKNGYESVVPRVRAINVRHNITLVSMDSINMWHQAGFMGTIFTVFKNLGLSIDIVVTAQTNITVSLDTADNVIDSASLERLESELAKYSQVKIIKNCSAVTLVGYRMRALLGHIAPIISSFSEQRIYLTSQSSNDLNTTVVVDEDQADKLLKALHEGLIPNRSSESDFGPTWEQLISRQQKEQKIPDQWWQTKRLELLELAQDQSPCYVYDKATIINQINKLKGLKSIDRIFYACKANSNKEVIKTIHSQGVGLETVSPGEIEHVQNSIAQLSTQDILFTPNFAAKQEYQLAVEKGLENITIDNVFILENWADIFTNQEVILRLDPGHGSGHHRYVRTAGEQSKFGIHASELEKVKQLCEQNNITVKGLHSHTGSGILSYKNWHNIIDYLTKQLEIFPSAKIINLGGGMGITENPYDKGLDMQALDEMLLEFKARFPQIQLWIEPGRFLVANSGVLLAKVTQTKVKGQHGYIGLETGMNSLIRPALYAAWHNIVNLTRLGEDVKFTASIVGPMCETGDILGIDRKVPETKSGDVFLIGECGAYGYSMASNYNRRKPAQEIFLG